MVRVVVGEIVTVKNIKRDLVEERYVGLHSGFPECCVDFYIWLASKELNVYYHTNVLQPYKQKNPDVDFAYQPCPVCLVNKKFVKSHYCTTECRRSSKFRKIARFQKLIKRKDVHWFYKESPNHIV